MVALIWSIVSPYAAPIIAALAGLLGLWGYGAAKKREGRQKAKSEAAAKQAKDYAETRKRIDDADIIGDDPDLARRWLRERSKRGGTL